MTTLFLQLESGAAGGSRGSPIKIPLLFLFAFALPAVGGMVVLPAPPAPVFADLETVTNAPIRASALENARVFLQSR